MEPAVGHGILSYFLRTHHPLRSATQIQTGSSVLASLFLYIQSHQVFRHNDLHRVKILIHIPVWTLWPGCCLSSVTLTGGEMEEVWLSGKGASFGWGHPEATRGLCCRFQVQMTQELLTCWILMPGGSYYQPKNTENTQIKYENTVI